MRHAPVKLEAEVIADPKGTAVNRSLARLSLRPFGKNRTEPCSSALKHASTSGGEGHQQGHREHGIRLRPVRRRRTPASERQLPQPLSGLPLLEARRPATGRPGGDVPRVDGARHAGAFLEEGPHDRPPLSDVRREPPKPGGRRPRTAGRDRGAAPARTGQTVLTGPSMKASFPFTTEAWRNTRTPCLRASVVNSSR
jgi:hypothetical protein